jgi:hypothetical protein
MNFIIQMILTPISKKFKLQIAPFSNKIIILLHEKTKINDRGRHQT